MTLALSASPARAEPDIAVCAGERTKTVVLTLPVLAAAEAACNRVLAGEPGVADKQRQPSIAA